MAKELTHEQIVSLLRQRQGQRTQKELAEELGISQQHLGDILRGQRTPGERILAQLGIRKEIVYRKQSA